MAEGAAEPVAESSAPADSGDLFGIATEEAAPVAHDPRLTALGATPDFAAAEAEAAARGCTQTVHFTWAFQAQPLYERAGYELVGRVAEFPAGTDVLWYRKRLNPPEVASGRRATRRS